MPRSPWELPPVGDHDKSLKAALSKYTFLAYYIPTSDLLRSSPQYIPSLSLSKMPAVFPSFYFLLSCS